MVGFIRIGDGKYSTKIVKVKGVFMAIYGIGAFYGGGIGNVTESFLLRNSACVGWEESDAPSLYQLIKYIKVGDIIYIKSKTPQKGLTIKAVGIVFDDQISYRKYEDIPRACRNVKWIWNGEKLLGKIGDKYNVRSITLYEEFNLNIQQEVINLLTSKLNR